MSNAAQLAWEDITVGMSASFTVHLSEKLVNQFLKLSGDYNPLHADETYAANTKFGHRVVPGMLLSSFFSKLVGMHIPGEKALYVSQSLAFKNPAFIGQDVTVEGVVIQISTSLHIVTLKTTVVDSKTHKTLVEGECRALYL